LISDCIAGAWLNEEGKFYSAEGLYHTFPSQSKTELFLPGLPSSTASIIRESYRIASTSELQYGLSEESTLKAKIDIGYVQDDYEVELIKGANRSKSKFTSEYTSINSEFTYRQQFYKDENNSVMSSVFSYFPGEYIIANRLSYLVEKQASFEARILQGSPFKSDINFFNILGGEGSERYHYFEWQLGARYFYHLNKIQWDFDQHLGIRPADKWLCVFSLYNTFIGASYSEKPYSTSDIASVLDLAESINFDSNQRNGLLNGLSSMFTQNSRYRDHKLNLKISYELEPNKHISLESFSNVFVHKPFTNNTVVLTYDMKF
jgi:hypothetical protein